jgi:hypothetical protein
MKTYSKATQICALHGFTSPQAGTIFFKHDFLCCLDVPSAVDDGTFGAFKHLLKNLDRVLIDIFHPWEVTPIAPSWYSNHDSITSASHDVQQMIGKKFYLLSINIFPKVNNKLVKLRQVESGVLEFPIPAKASEYSLRFTFRRYSLDFEKADNMLLDMLAIRT